MWQRRGNPSTGRQGSSKKIWPCLRNNNTGVLGLTILLQNFNGKWTKTTLWELRYAFHVNHYWILLDILPTFATVKQSFEWQIACMVKGKTHLIYFTWTISSWCTLTRSTTSLKEMAEFSSLLVGLKSSCVSGSSDGVLENLNP